MFACVETITSLSGMDVKMREIQNIFNNREIAIGIWVMLVAIISIFTKPVKKFLKSVFPILFCRKFVVFYIVFLLHLCLVTYFLYAVGFWSVALLKDTIFWVLCVELPLFVKTIEKAKDNHFFVKLIKDNITISVIIEFVFNFWTFNLFTEILIVPISIFIGLLYALAAREKKYFQVKRFFDWLFVIFGVIIIINSCKHLYENPSELFNLSTLQEFLLPAFLLLLNLPVVYGLSKITAIRNNLQYITVISLTDNDMKENLKKLKNKLSMRVGDNYMKRANYYILWCIIGFLISVLGIVICNSQVSIRDFLKFNFTVDIQRVKEIITYICSTGVVFSVCLFIYSLGFRKKKNEEISQVKKFALHNLLYLIKRQYNMLQEFPPIDEPKELFVKYITIAYELKAECEKDIVSFENLLSSWEFDTIKQLQTSATNVVFSIGINEAEIGQYTIEQFNAYYLERETSAPQNEKINVFTYDVQKGIENYSKQIKMCVEEFKRYF